jgi:hypothetical protein
MAAPRFWIAREDLPAVMGELSEVFSLGLSAAYIGGLDDALEETWYGSTYTAGKLVQDPWITLAHDGDADLQIEMAQDECGGVFIGVRCAEPDFARIKAVLIKYNPCNESTIYKSNST